MAGNLQRQKKGRLRLTNSKETPDPNPGTTVKPRRRHHRNRQGQEEQLKYCRRYYNKSGHQAIQEIETWYGSAATSQTIINRYRSRLEGIKLTEETTASSYVNKFLICSSKLEKKREGYTAATKRHKFLDQIKDDNYNVVKQQLQGDTSIDFDACVKRIRYREQDLSTDEKLEEKGCA